jgi:hypothetical protein
MVRRSVALKSLMTQHIGTDDMVADGMSKALAVMKFFKFRAAMKVLPIVASEAVASTAAAPAAAVHRSKLGYSYACTGPRRW